jgi:hypothetical protein
MGEKKNAFNEIGHPTCTTIHHGNLALAGVWDVHWRFIAGNLHFAAKADVTRLTLTRTIDAIAVVATFGTQLL